jgi:hypothetical protein
VNSPAVGGGMVDGDASLGHHLLKVPETEIIGQVPPDADQDDRAIKMPALEQLASPSAVETAGTAAETVKQTVATDPPNKLRRLRVPAVNSG